MVSCPKIVQQVCPLFLCGPTEEGSEISEDPCLRDNLSQLTDTIFQEYICCPQSEEELAYVVPSLICVCREGSCPAEYL